MNTLYLYVSLLIGAIARYFVCLHCVMPSLSFLVLYIVYLSHPSVDFGPLYILQILTKYRLGNIYIIHCFQVTGLLYGDCSK
jgi:hypothetical protein